MLLEKTDAAIIAMGDAAAFVADLYKPLAPQRSSRDNRRSASTLPPVWQWGQYVTS